MQLSLMCPLGIFFTLYFYIINVILLLYFYIIIVILQGLETLDEA